MFCGEPGTGHEPPEDRAAGKFGAAHQGGTPVLSLEPDQKDRESRITGDIERTGAV